MIAVTLDAAMDKRKQFTDVWPVLRDEVLAYLKEIGMPQEAVSWFQRVSITSLY